MKELIVKPSFSSKITVNNEYLEKQLIDLSIKGGEFLLQGFSPFLEFKAN